MVQTSHQNSSVVQTVQIISGVYLFFVTIIIAPLVNLPVFYPEYTATKLFLVVSAALLALVQLYLFVPRFKASIIRVVPRFVKLSIVVTTIGFTLSTLLSESLKTSLFGLFSYWESNAATNLLLFVLGLAWFAYFLALRQSHNETMVFKLLISIATFVISLVAIGEFFIWHNSTGYVVDTAVRVSLGFRNPLIAAYFIGVLWVSAASQLLQSLTFGAFAPPSVKQAVALSTKKNGRSIVELLIPLTLFVLNTLALIFTFTRSAWISAASGLAALMVIQLYAQRSQIKIAAVRMFVATIMMAAITFCLAWPFGTFIVAKNNDMSVESQATLTTIAATLGSTDVTSAAPFYQNSAAYSSASIRLLEWKWGLRTWLGSVKNFFVGVGPDAGYFVLPKFRDPLFNNFPTDAAVKPNAIRSLYVNFLLEYGVIGSLGALALVMALWHCIATRLKSEPELLLPLSLFVGYFAQGVFYNPPLLSSVLLAFSIGFTLSVVISEDSVDLATPNNSEKFLIILTFIVILSWIIPVAKASLTLQQYSLSALPMPETTMVENTKLPINSNIMKRFLAYYYPTSNNTVRILPDLLASNNPDDLHIAGDAYYLISKNAADLPNATAALQLSASAYKKLTDIDGTLPASWDALGIRYLALHQLTDAQSAFKKAVSLKSDYWYAYLHLGETLRQQCNPTEAIDWYKKAELYVPLSANEILEAQQEIKAPRAECGGK